MKTPPFVRTPYNYNTNEAGDKSGLACKDPTRTQQSFKDDADINSIVRKFHITGKLPTNIRMPIAEDYQGIGDFMDAMNAIRKGQEAFAEMPADVRKRFNHDAGEFVEFCMNPENRAEAEKLGLVDPRKPQVPPAEGPKGGGSTPAAAPATASPAPSTTTP